MRVLIRSLLRRVRSRLLLLWSQLHDGEMRCSTTGVSFRRMRSGTVYDFNNEYRGTNSNMESNEEPTAI